MKKLQNYIVATILFLAAFSISKAQQINIDPETKKVLFQESVPLDSLNKDQIYERATEWMTNQFKTNKFDLNDKANHKLMHTGEIPVTYTYDFKYKSENTVLFNLTFNIKDGKYRYTLTDFKVFDNKLGAKSAQPLELAYQKMKADIKKEFANNFNIEVNKFISDLKINMATGKKPNPEEEWD